MSKKVCFLYKNPDYVVDGMRSALGLSVENNYAFGAVLCKMDKLDEHNMENLDWIRDMEGEVFSTLPENCETNGLTPITLEELGQKLREMDFIIPFGTK
ncbi:MAG TPA: hypothetical protein ENN98_03670 [Desulfurivibrio alkaliphilus]|uniref:Uncharacterized protein n=1 Tax=Desulfurivibrio alkaliphilus TaxID=427923 RepID=A0A7C2TJB7_9BACT|nr:hypothetical protein [Desulfurivibrio alkaliphilus]